MAGFLLLMSGQARGEPERAETGGGGHTQFAKDFFLTVANARGGGVKSLGHGRGGVEQKLALLGQDQSARVAVEEVGIKLFLKPANLPTDGRLRQVKLVPCMGQRPGIGHGVKNSEFVPIHGPYFPCPAFLLP